MLNEMMTYIIERSNVFTTALAQHLYLTFIGLSIAIFLGVSLGIISTRIPWLRKTILGLGKIGQTIPSMAVLALALPLLGIGAPPTILALVFVGTLPIMVNTNVGIEQVDASIKESARGIGLNDFQVLIQVELPIASTVIMAGIRTSAVVVVASATLAGFIGGGGLGDLILRGHYLGRDHIMLAGAIPATLLAFYFEEIFGRLQEWSTPIGLKINDPTTRRKKGSGLSLLSAATALPLLFGALLPWFILPLADGNSQPLTGLHSPFSTLAVPALLLGLLAAIWPNRSSDQPTWLNMLFTTGAALIASVTMLAGILFAWDLLALGIGFYLQATALIILLVCTVMELRMGLSGRSRLASQTQENQHLKVAAGGPGLSD